MKKVIHFVVFAHDSGRTINGTEVCVGRHGVYPEEYPGITSVPASS